LEIAEFEPAASKQRSREDLNQAWRVFIWASKKDMGKAVWNGPLGGNSPAKELGDVYRSGGCWTASDSSGSPGRQWHAEELLDDLIESGSQIARSVDKYVLNAALA
jgi:hypothetical protein